MVYRKFSYTRLELAVIIKPITPPREFEGGIRAIIKDCAHIELEADEQVTFFTDSGAEYDVIRKEWGFYATPSLNYRLLKFNLKAALIKGKDGKFYIFLVEKDKYDLFEQYIGDEGHIIILWMDTKESLSKIEYFFSKLYKSELYLKCPCDSNLYIDIFQYTSPPEGEIRFKFSKLGEYKRNLLKCPVCGHFLSIHKMSYKTIYEGDYVSSNYKDDNGIYNTFNKIISLNPDMSDNKQRVKRIINFFSDILIIKDSEKPCVLDVGSGLCVFLYEMKKYNWQCTALDPDIRNVKHAQKNVGIKALCNDFMHIDMADKYDLITFNKVLEHVIDPIEMLKKSQLFLKPQGVVYIELPDGEKAKFEGFDREEFFIDHHHIFSATSFSIMIDKAGFEIINIGRLREPSSKYTLYCFTKLKKE